MNTKEEAARLALIEGIENFIGIVMGWPKDKAHTWMITGNPHLGEVPPMTLVLQGRSHKVMAFIEAATEWARPLEDEFISSEKIISITCLNCGETLKHENANCKCK